MSGTVDVIRSAIHETAMGYHLSAPDIDGNLLTVPASYQIYEEGFRPYLAGKATPEQLQARLDDIVAKAQATGVELGLETEGSLEKLLVQKGLGIDCSRFVFQSLTLVHERLQTVPYVETVNFETAEILDRYRKGWRPRPTQDNPAPELTKDELEFLNEVDRVDAPWVARVFNRDPAFIIGSAHICSDVSSVQVEPEELVPGDQIAFHTTGSNEIHHNAVVTTVEDFGEFTDVSFWHSWHTRDNVGSGLRNDMMRLDHGSRSLEWSHKGLGNPRRYQAYSFHRPSALAVLLAAESSDAQ